MYRTALLSTIGVLAFSAALAGNKAHEAAATATEEALPITTVAGETGAVNSAILEEAETQSDILDTAAATGQFSKFLELVEAAGMKESLKAEGPFTVFAPTDEALSSLGDEQFAALKTPEKKEELKKILSYHIIPTELTAENITDAQQVASLEGSNLAFSRNAETEAVMVGEATVVSADIMASNGVLHGINAVLSIPAEEEEGAPMVN